MRNLRFIFLLIWFTGLNATLTQLNMAQILQVSEKLAKRIIERIEYIDRLNTSYASYYPILSKILKERNYKIGCEIGIFTGGHAEFVLSNSSVEKLYCIDPYITPKNVVTIITDGFEKIYWQTCWDAIYYYTMDKLSAFGNRAQFIRLPAEQAAIRIDDHNLDFIFIDGDHSYDAVFADCTNYYNKVRSGGIIAGDDYDINDVGQAVRDFFEQKNLIINIYPGQKRFWWVEKP